LEQFHKLRGGGQITEAEGAKATDALTAINGGMGEEEFVREVLRTQAAVMRSANIAREKLGQKPMYNNVLTDEQIDAAKIKITTPVGQDQSTISIDYGKGPVVIASPKTKGLSTEGAVSGAATEKAPEQQNLSPAERARQELERRKQGK
jgi:hypothetical protein